MNNDLISREALKEQAETVTLWNGDVRRFVSYETIDNAPTVLHDNYSEGYQDGVKKVLSERPQGEWKWENNGCFCSECQVENEYQTYYCPNCGADMRKGGRS